MPLLRFCLEIVRTLAMETIDKPKQCHAHIFQNLRGGHDHCYLASYATDSKHSFSDKLSLAFTANIPSHSRHTLFHIHGTLCLFPSRGPLSYDKQNPNLRKNILGFWFISPCLV